MDIENLDITKVEAALSNIDLNTFNSDYNTIVDETASSKYSSVKPPEMIESLDLSSDITDTNGLKPNTADVVNKIKESLNRIVH